MNKKIAIVLCIIGILFLLNAILGRYIVLPGYFQSLEMGSAGSQLPENVPIFKIIRYLLWAFSFKLGIYFFILGTLFYSNQKIKDRSLFSIIGLVYISVAYVEIPIDQSLLFGIGGVILTLSFLYLFANINITNNKRLSNGKTLYLNFGYYFLTMAAYNLCPFCGVYCFALKPEKMIKYGFQNQAISTAYHIMIELVVGFICLCIYYRTKNVKNTGSDLELGQN